MTEQWLVDGMNVIGSGAAGWWNDPDRAIRDLIDRLQAFARTTGDSVTVVFDYRPVGLRVGTGAGVKVRFGHGERQAADDLILRAVIDHPNPETVRVVTSDRTLRAAVEATGADVVSSGTFRRRVDAARSASVGDPRRKG